MRPPGQSVAHGAIRVRRSRHRHRERSGAQEASDPHAVQPERPTVATHAGTVAPGWLEIETGVEHDRFEPSVSTAFTPTVLKFGLASHAQLGVFGSASTTRRRRASATLAPASNGESLDDALFLGDFAVLPAMKFPTGDVEEGHRHRHDRRVVAVDLESRRWARRRWTSTSGYTRRSGDGSDAYRRTRLCGRCRLAARSAGSLGWTAECYGYPGTGACRPAAAPIVALLAGPTFLFRKWLALDAGVIVPLAGPQPHALYAGAVYNVGRM